MYLDIADTLAEGEYRRRNVIGGGTAKVKMSDNWPVLHVVL